MHEPVLKNEIIRFFQIEKRAHLHRPLIIDATLGAGGHSIEFIKNGAKVLGIEADSTMLESARKRLKKACPIPNSIRDHFILVHGNFRDIDNIAREYGFDKADGILFDLGVSIHQLTSRFRGFSFTNPDADLDMRIDPDSNKVTAKDLLNALNTAQLKRVFGVSLDAYSSTKLAERVVETRKSKQFLKVGDFLDLIKKGYRKEKRVHPATLPLMALRIAVNSELNNLKLALPKSFSLLGRGGRLAIISFHSGEDLIVKNFFRSFESRQAQIITKKPVTPGVNEIHKNPRARSAKLRVITKL